MGAILSNMPKASHSRRRSERERRIRAWIREGEARLVARRIRLLAHRDALGLFLFLASIAGMVGLGWLYATGAAPAAVVDPRQRVSSRRSSTRSSTTLIHVSISGRGPRSQPDDARGLGVSRERRARLVPKRRSICITTALRERTTDVEERLLGLGQPFGFRRMLVMVDGAMAYLLNARTLAEGDPRLPKELALAGLPSGLSALRRGPREPMS